MKNIISLFPILLFAFGFTANAQSEIRIKTKWDLYDLKKTGSHYTIEGKKVDSTHLEPLLTMLSTPATAPCPNDFKSQVFITPNPPKREQGEIRINLDKGILKGPEGCLTISGSGLDAFPLHRSWLIGPFKRSLDPKESLVFSSPQVKFKAGLRNKEWSISPLSPTFNHEFFEQFVSSLKDFKIERYIHLSGAKGKPEVRLIIDGKKSVLYQLGPTTWGMREPRRPWLMISPDWSLWKDLDKDQWTDSYADGITTLLSKEASAAQKEEQLKKLGASWSESLKRAYQQCLLSDSNETDVRLLCLQKLKRRPTENNLRVVFSLIEQTENPRLLREAADVLRIKNPDGPRFSDDTNLEEFRQEWKRWWIRFSH